MIWKNLYTIEELASICKNTMVSNLAIEFLEIGDDFLSAKMPVDSRTIQPSGILHGGASVALAETIGSVAGQMTIDPQKFLPVGIEINANHIKSKKNGYIIGTGRPLHLGKSTQVWNVDISDEQVEVVKHRIKEIIVRNLQAELEGKESTFK